MDAHGVLELRRQRRWGADHIGFEVGLAASTVQGILNQAGVGRLDRGDRATKREPARRYQRENPGELIHVDVKKLAGIPPGGGWRVRGRGYRGEDAASRRVGYRYIPSAIDDHTRIVYSEILDNEQAVTAAGFWQRDEVQGSAALAVFGSSICRSLLGSVAATCTHDQGKIRRDRVGRGATPG